MSSAAARSAQSDYVRPVPSHGDRLRQPGRVGETRRRTQRLGAVLDALGATGEVDVGELSARLGVSASTLRRDLARLEEQKLLVRTHGGAVRTRGQDSELPVRYRDSLRDVDKLAIAEAVVAALPAGRLVIGLTGGTTTTAVAHLLAAREGLTVVTNAINIAADLALGSSARVFLTGGFMRSRSYEVVGPSAVQALSGLTLHSALVGVDGISAAAGLTTFDEVEAATNQAMIRRAKRVVVVADGSKVGRELVARMAPVDAVDELVTTAPVDPEALRALRRAGVAVTVVGGRAPAPGEAGTEGARHRDAAGGPPAP